MKRTILIYWLCAWSCLAAEGIQTNAPQSAQATPQRFTRHQQIQAWLETKNLEINFYGKVIDHDGKPLSGAKVKLHIRQWYEQSPLNVQGKQVNFELVSDTRGLISMHGAKGDSIGMDSVELEGHEVSRSAYYLPSVSDTSPDNPKIIKMWRKRGAEPMIYSGGGQGIPCDGTPARFDLLRGFQNANGNLRVTLIRNPLHPTPREKYDWKATLEIIGGGLVAQNDEFPFWSPEGGYVQSLTFENHAGDGQWSKDFKQSFYLKTAEGYYGRLSVKLATNFDPPPTQFSFECFLNPSGSRNLEYDEAKRIYQK